MTSRSSFGFMAGYMAVVALTSTSVRAESFEQWVKTQEQRSLQGLLANIHPAGTSPGIVVASPSRAGPDYFFHWIRDAALVMDVVVSQLERSSGATRAALVTRLQDYVELSRLNQLTPNRSGTIDTTGLGEPKFNVDGSAFDAAWGRPQNDGPALRALTLIRFARLLIRDGQSDYVRAKLYAARIPAATVIKADLEFVSHRWRDSNFDLWEEVLGQHFYTRIVQRRALVEGAALADSLGDGAAAAFYRGQARDLEGAIQEHWSERKGQLVATVARDGGAEVKVSGLDAAVVLGALHARGNDTFYGPCDDRVLATAEKLVASFRRLYGINERELDFQGEALGPAIGRYPEDIYDGNGTSRGNPWFLTTAALAELHYRCAAQWKREGRITITAQKRAFFGKTAPASLHQALAAGTILRREDVGFDSLLAATRANGDSFLRRVRLHAGPDGALSEQLNRDSGYLQGARDLTWSYAAFVTAVQAR